MSKKDDLLKKLTQRDTEKPPLDITYEQKGEVIKQFSGEENNEKIKEENKIKRRRCSFDIRTDLHKRLKLVSAFQDKNIYELIEEAVEKYLDELEKEDEVIKELRD